MRPLGFKVNFWMNSGRKDPQSITNTWWRRNTKRWRLSSKTYYSQYRTRQTRSLQKLSRNEVVQSFTSKACKRIKCSKRQSKRHCTRSQRSRLPSQAGPIFSSVIHALPRVLLTNSRSFQISKCRIGTLPSHHMEVSGMCRKGRSLLSLCLRSQAGAVLRLNGESIRIYR